MSILEKTRTSYLRSKAPTQSYLTKMYFEEVGASSTSPADRGNLARSFSEPVDTNVYLVNDIGNFLTDDNGNLLIV